MHFFPGLFTMLALCWSLQVGFFICYKLVVFLDVPIFQAILKLNELLETFLELGILFNFDFFFEIGENLKLHKILYQ